MALREKGALKDFLGCEVTSKNFIKYPTILDKDPRLAAHFLTKADATSTLKLMIEAFSLLEDNPSEYFVLSDSILHSAKNFDWFCAFTLELETLVEDRNLEIDYHFHLKPKKETNRLAFQPPMKVKNKKVSYEKFRVKITDPINLYRICYIREYFEPDDFLEGLPAWYVMNNTTVLETYNEKTNVRARIDFRDGEFFYFISGASDNWQQVCDVPLEMDHIVSALLFRN